MYLRQSHTAIIRAVSRQRYSTLLQPSSTLASINIDGNIDKQKVRCYNSSAQQQGVAGLILSDYDREKSKSHQQHNNVRWSSTLLPSASSISTDQDNRYAASTLSSNNNSSTTATANLNITYEEANNLTNEQIVQKLNELYTLLLTKVPKGFENFLPKGARTGGDNSSGGDDNDNNEDKNSDKDTKSSSDKKDTTKKSDSKKKKKKTFNSSGGFGSNNNNKKKQQQDRKKKEDEDMQSQLIGTTALLIAVLMARSIFDDDVNGGGV